MVLQGWRMWQDVCCEMVVDDTLEKGA